MRNFFQIRQVVAMCAVAMSLLGLTAQPAMAAGGYASIERAYDLSGDRHGLRMDARVTDAAVGSGLGLGANWGNMNGESYSSTALIFTQGAGTAASRGLKFDGYGQFKAVDGNNCNFAAFGGGFGRLTCTREGYDWVVDRAYRMVVTRGDSNDKGRLWNVFLVDRATDVKIRVVSFRAPFDRMSDSGVYAYSNIANCDNVNAFKAVVARPVGDDGTSVAWGATTGYSEGCPEVTRTATVNDGKVTLRIQ